MRTLKLNAVDVRYRLGFLVFISIVALLAVGAGGGLGISRVSHSVIALQNERLPAAMSLAEIRVSSNLLVQLSYEVLTREKQAFAQSKFAQTLARKDAVNTTLTESMNVYEALPKTEDEKEAWNSFKEAMTPWKAGNAELSGLIKAMAENDDPDKQLELFSQYKVPLANWGYTQARVDLALSSLLSLNKDEVEKARDSDARTIKLSMAFMVTTAAVAVLILLVLAVICVRSITAPLGRLRKTIVGVADHNDFTERADVRGKDEIAQTAAAFNRLLEDVQESLREVLDNAENIAVASDKASSTSRQAAESAGNQSEAASGMAAAIEEMTVSISHINEGAQDTLGRAQAAGEAAKNGAESIAQSHTEMDQIAKTMTQATLAIEKLSKESSSISTILQVIKEVADQTNLLALNAAIEAARAGEQGRGFAVVADEVRKLAERTTASTQAIGDLVVSMQSSGEEAVSWMHSVNQQVTNGKQLSDVAVGHIDEIRDSSRHVVDSVTDISDAINEQSSTAQNIAQQVEMVARLSEVNSTTAKETETISMDLDRLAARLRQAVSKFNV